MSVKGMYCVRDEKAAYYMSPFPAISDGIAIRNIRAAMQGENDISKFPQDFSLWKIGEYDDETGKVSGTNPTHIANCVELVQKEQKVNSDDQE